MHDIQEIILSSPGNRVTFSSITIPIFFPISRSFEHFWDFFCSIKWALPFDEMQMNVHLSVQ